MAWVRRELRWRWWCSRASPVGVGYGVVVGVNVGVGVGVGDGFGFASRLFVFVLLPSMFPDPRVLFSLSYSPCPEHHDPLITS